nr:hypothetical protein [Eilatimonas milleporae]
MPHGWYKSVIGHQGINFADLAYERQDKRTACMQQEQLKRSTAVENTQQFRHCFSGLGMLNREL